MRGKDAPRIVCPTCDGAGWIVVAYAGERGQDATHRDCPDCGGSGRL